MLNIVKIGGNIIDNEPALQTFLQKFCKIGESKILVHGGGRLATQMCEKLGIPQQFADGRRITCEDTLRIAAMVYAGWINKHIVALLQAGGCNALGLSGADAACIPALRRPPVPVDYGFVGDVVTKNINCEFLQTLLQQEITPVFCAITYDSNGNLLNTNADSIASSLASAMSKRDTVRLTFCFEKNGVLANPDDDNSVVPILSSATYAELKYSGSITAGMIPKIDNAFAALQAGADEVIIKHALHLDKDGGTRVVAD
jgi:acetylglutamate kinase